MNNPTVNLSSSASSQVLADHLQPLNAAQAAVFLDIDEATLVSYTARDIGPAHRKIEQSYFYDVPELQRWLRARQWHEMGGRCERNKLPTILWNLFQDGAFTLDEDHGYRYFDVPLLAVAVEDAWSSAEYPENALDFWLWQDLFNEASEHLVYPDVPVTLYRGAGVEPSAARRMSWTSTLETARWFADRFGGGFVYRIGDVQPQYVLAQITRGRDEDEYVLDPEYLDGAPIEVHEDRRQHSVHAT